MFDETDTEGIFKGLESLERLYLRDNRIRSIRDGVFKGLGNLKNLNLDHNTIDSLRSGAFRGLTRLSHINLHDSVIFTLDADVFADQPRPLKLDIIWSVLPCDQSLCWFLREIHNGTIEIDGAPHYCLRNGQDWTATMRECVRNG